MENIIITPDSKKQSSIIKAFLREMKINFKTAKNDDTRMSKDDFYRKISDRSKEASEGNVVRIQDLKELNTHLQSL